MQGVNNVILMGNLTRDIEKSFGPTGTPTVKFSLAVNERARDGEEETNYFDIVAFGSIADLCGENLKKGSPAGIFGRLRFRKLKPSGNGDGKTKMEVIARRVLFLKKPKPAPAA